MRLDRVGWTLRTDYGGYGFACSDYPSVPSVDAELQASRRNFAHAMSRAMARAPAR